MATNIEFFKHLCQEAGVVYGSDNDRDQNFIDNFTKNVMKGIETERQEEIFKFLKGSELNRASEEKLLFELDFFLQELRGFKQIYGQYNYVKEQFEEKVHQVAVRKQEISLVEEEHPGQVEKFLPGMEKALNMQ